MRKALIAIAAVAALHGSSALAADMGMPMRAPLPPPPPPTWTGCYVDAGYGYGLWDQNQFTSLIGRSGSSTFRLSTISASMSLAGSRFSSESAPRLFHHGFRGRDGTI
jgi:opacity protein-like surface antigen